MKKITIKIDERSKAAKSFIEFMKTLSFITIQDNSKTRYNAETEKVINDAKKGIDVHSVKSSKELFKKLGI